MREARAYLAAAALRHRPGRLLVAGAVAALLLLPAASAGAVSSGRAVQLLNQQRAAHGLPAGIRERPDWSDACRKHNRYMELNNEFTHDEQPGRPGYTPEGAWAGQNSVLAGVGELDWEYRNPWEDAPIHLAQLLAPALIEMGVNQSQAYLCATTWPGYNRPYPGPSASYSYPGNGARGVPYEQQASESPFVPGDFVGLPQGTVTGPHLYVYGPWLPGGWIKGRVVAASLRGPRGPVEVRWVDNSTSQVGHYLPRPSGIVIPARPLAPSATYHAHVSLIMDGGSQVQRGWSFTTAAVPPPPPADERGRRGRSSGLRIVSVRRRGRRVAIRVRVRRGARGRLRVRVGKRRLRARVRRSRRARRTRSTVTYRYTATLPRGRRNRGRWTVVASFRGRRGWRSARKVRRFRVGRSRRGGRR